jgi:hypothetical protein
MKRVSVYIWQSILSFSNVGDLGRFPTISKSCRNMSNQLEKIWQRQFEDDWGPVEHEHPLLLTEKSYKKRYQMRNQVEVNWSTSRCETKRHDFFEVTDTMEFKSVPSKPHLLVVLSCTNGTFYLLDTLKKSVEALLVEFSQKCHPHFQVSSEHVFVWVPKEPFIHIFTLKNLTKVSTLPTSSQYIFNVQSNEVLLICQAIHEVSVFDLQKSMEKKNLERVCSLEPSLMVRELFVDWDTLRGFVVFQGFVHEICLRTGQTLRRSQQQQDIHGSFEEYLPNAKQLVCWPDLVSAKASVVDTFSMKSLPTRSTGYFQILRGRQNQKKPLRDICVLHQNRFESQLRLMDALTLEKFPPFPEETFGQILTSTAYSLFILIRRPLTGYKLVEHLFLGATGP